MVRWLLFFHVTCVALWLGSISAVYILHRKAMAVGNAQHALAIETTRSVIRGIMNPCSIVVLITGITMLMQMGLVGRERPFWLAFMEQFGGLVILLSVGLLTWQMRRLAASAETQASLGNINRVLTWIGAGIVAVLLVVLLRLG